MKENIKRYLKRKLSPKAKHNLRGLVDNLKAIGSGRNLTALAKIYGTDKYGGHFYTPHYQTHLEKYKYKAIRLLEIGVGGYDDPYTGGNSLRMWKKYFPFGRIYSLDIYDKSPLEEKRIQIFKGSQVDAQFLDNVLNQTGDLDIIIDDGSHINEHVIETFRILFPKLKSNGLYIIEDTQTSYWSDFGGDSEDLLNPKTMMNFFKGLTDGLNHKEFIKPGYKQNYYDRTIISIHFYHNLIFIYKGENNEESNVLVNNQIGQ
jgi:demethylmacrocin O-methyltransferase